MTPSTKIFATLSLSAAVGEKIRRLNESGLQSALGASLYQAGYEATGAYPYPDLSGSKTRQILGAMEAMLLSPLDPPSILSMLIAGLVDIQAKCKPDRQLIIDPVIYCAQACLDAYPGKIDHEAAWERYEKWVSND